MSRDHRKLRAFELADEFVIAVYKATRSFPKEELFGLTAQLRRAAISVPTNIVEGCGRKNQGEFQQFLNVAMGSLREAGYQISLAGRLGFLSSDSAATLTAAYEETARVLSGLMTWLDKRPERAASSLRTQVSGLKSLKSRQ